LILIDFPIMEYWLAPEEATGDVGTSENVALGDSTGLALSDFVYVPIGLWSFRLSSGTGGPGSSRPIGTIRLVGERIVPTPHELRKSEEFHDSTHPTSGRNDYVSIVRP
jgi:hypothetical protein